MFAVVPRSILYLHPQTCVSILQLCYFSILRLYHIYPVSVSTYLYQHLYSIETHAMQQSQKEDRRAQYLLSCVAHIIEIHSIYYKTTGFSIKKQYLDRHICTFCRELYLSKVAKGVSIL